MAVEIRIGTSGWSYPRWRGHFYPKGLPAADQLRHLAERLNSVEINASFYRLQTPASYRSWADQTPPDFRFAVKGSRYLTHMKRLRDATEGLDHFLDSGVRELGPKLGPMLWQLPANLPYDPDQIESFLACLADKTPGVRHAFEVRHDSYRSRDYLRQLTDHGVANVIADSAGKWPCLTDVTATFAYVRLHGHHVLYTSEYGRRGLQPWASKIKAWVAEERDAYVYFDNDAHCHAPNDAMLLQEMVS